MGQGDDGGHGRRSLIAKQRVSTSRPALDAHCRSTAGPNGRWDVELRWADGWEPMVFKGAHGPDGVAAAKRRRTLSYFPLSDLAGSKHMSIAALVARRQIIRDEIVKECLDLFSDLAHKKPCPFDGKAGDDIRS